MKKNSIAYDNSVEIEGAQATRQAMADVVSLDNGKGGTGDANNREYGGTIQNNGEVIPAEPGDVTSPRYSKTATVTIMTDENTKSTFHSHQSGTVTEREIVPAGTIKTPRTDTYSFAQTPSPQDLQGAQEGQTRYVFGRGDGNVYIYNSNGVQAVIPFKNFVNPQQD